VLVFLVAAALIVPVIHRRGVEPVLAFLAVGLMIGPLALTRVVRDLPSSAFAPARRSFFAAVHRGW
jgi:Kef-type K+ transport system membrane component KefB